VETIGWRATRLRDLDTGTLIIVPNATLAAATVTNFGAAGSTFTTVTVTVPDDADLEAVEQAASRALASLTAESEHADVDRETTLRFVAAADHISLVVGAHARTHADVGALTHELVMQLVPRIREATSGHVRIPD
jgi:small-conductance mechanosensitive channel